MEGMHYEFIDNYVESLNLLNTITSQNREGSNDISEEENNALMSRELSLYSHFTVALIATLSLLQLSEFYSVPVGVSIVPLLLLELKNIISECIKSKRDITHQNFTTTPETLFHSASNFTYYLLMIFYSFSNLLYFSLISLQPVISSFSEIYFLRSDPYGIISYSRTVIPN